MLKAKDVYERIARGRVMDMMASDAEFSYTVTKATVEYDKDKNQYYYLVVFGVSEEKHYITIKDEYEEKIIRRMMKNPQNIMSVLVSMIIDDEIQSVVEVVYEKGSLAKGTIYLTEFILDKYIEFRNITDIKEIESMVTKYEIKKQSEPRGGIKLPLSSKYGSFGTVNTLNKKGE